MKKIFRIGAMTLIGASVLMGLGCNKKKDTIAKIYVRNAANELVAGATVHLYGDPTEPATGGQPTAVTLDMTSTTNSSGVATFNFNEVYQQGQAGVVVASIEVFKDGATGQGIIKVDQETVSEETVFL